MKKVITYLMSWVTIGAMAQSLTPTTLQLECGDMLYRTPTTYTIEFKNDGNEPVEIKSVDTGCGCTIASYTQGLIQPFATAQVSLTFDCNQLGHFSRNVSVAYSSASIKELKLAEVLVNGNVVTKMVNYSGEYPFKKGELLTDKDNIEFDDVNQGQKFTQEIHIMNPSGQNVEPVLLRLPEYLTAEMTPAMLAPRQSGIMRVTLNSGKLTDYGLNQIAVLLGKNSMEKFSHDKTITISAVLLPPAVPQDEVSRPYAPKISLSKDYVDMTSLEGKSQSKDVITIKNNGRKPLEIQKLQFFTTGLQVKLGDRTIEPGGSTHLEVTCKSKEMKNLNIRPRILMITNDPDKQKVVIEIKDGTSRE